MPDNNPKSTASIAGHPIHPMLIPFPIAFLVAALFCDLAFWYSGVELWTVAATWLLGAGVVMGLAAAVFGFADFFGEARIRALNDAWEHMIGNLAVVLLAAINWYQRYGEGAVEGVFPWGIWLSLGAVLMLLYTGWKGWEMVHRHRVGVADATPADVRGELRATDRPHHA